jgi:hypothetical protein
MTDELELLLDIWDEHAVVHRSCYRVRSGTACPSIYNYFDAYAVSEGIDINTEEFLDFLVEHPNVRISGRTREELVFRSEIPVDDDPVVTYHKQKCNDLVWYDRSAVSYRCEDCGAYFLETPAGSTVEGRVEPAINEVGTGATDGSGIILEQILATLNNIDKSLAVLVESSKQVPVVVALDPQEFRHSPMRIQRTVNVIKEYLTKMRTE